MIMYALNKLQLELRMFVYTGFIFGITLFDLSLIITILSVYVPKVPNITTGVN